MSSLPAVVNRLVVRCPACKLHQYRTRNGRCRKCLQPLSAAIQEPAKLLVVVEKLSFTPSEGIENLGKRILFLRREVLGVRQADLEQGDLKCTSRSYLSRLETGLMTPSLGWLEKFSETVGIPLRIVLTPNFTDFSITHDRWICQILALSREFKFTPSMWVQVIELVKKAVEFRTTERAVNQVYKEQHGANRARKDSYKGVGNGNLSRK